jgi:hypothetical protein
MGVLVPVITMGVLGLLFSPIAGPAAMQVAELLLRLWSKAILLLTAARLVTLRG